MVGTGVFSWFERQRAGGQLWNARSQAGRGTLASSGRTSCRGNLGL